MTSLKKTDEPAVSQDIRTLSARRHNPFKNRKTGPDNYLEFVAQYNDFINHRPKPFRKMVARLMKL